VECWLGSGLGLGLEWGSCVVDSSCDGRKIHEERALVCGLYMILRRSAGVGLAGVLLIR